MGIATGSRRETAGVAIFGLTNIVVFQVLFTISPVMLLWNIAVTLEPCGASPSGDPPSSQATVGAYWALLQTLNLDTPTLAIRVEQAARATAINATTVDPVLLLSAAAPSYGVEDRVDAT